MMYFSHKTIKKLYLCLGSCLLLSSTSSQDSFQDVPLLRRIRDYWKEGDYALAKKQILTALDRYPNGALAEELHLLLGDLYMQDGNFSAALEEYLHLQKEELIERTLYNKALCFYETKQKECLLELFYALPTGSAFLSKEQANQIRFLCAHLLYSEKNPQDIAKAIDLFESCLSTTWATESLAPLAQLCLQLEDTKKAVFYLTTLAQTNQELAPDLLFKAGLIIAESDPTTALSLFQKVLTMPSDQKGPAAYNSLLLQYELEQFEKVVLTYEESQSLFSSEQKVQATQLLGKSLYSLKDYERAPAYLLSNLEIFPLETQKHLCSIALECAYLTNNLELYQEILQKIVSLYEEEPIPAPIQLAFLNLLQKNNQTAAYIESVKIFLASYPDHEQKSELQLSLGHSFYEEKQWQQAENTFTSFLEENPNCEQKIQILRLLVNCAAEKLKESSEEAVSVHRRHWLCRIQDLLQTPLALSVKERQLLLLELIKGLFQEGNYPEALAISEELLMEFPDLEQKQEVELIQTICYFKDPSSPLLFVISAEKLLQNFPQIAQADALRLHLFNTYLELSNDPASIDKDELLAKAAEHLYFIFTNKSVAIKQENLQWLAEYYEKTANSPQDPSLPKAIALYEELFPNVSLEKQEKIAYKLCRLFSLSSELEKKQDLLTPLLAKISSPETSLQKQLILELAQTYETQQNLEEALSLYNTLICHCGASQIGSQALLQRSKILFTKMPMEEKNEENVFYLEILDNLKDLELRKDPLLYPLYLEAGLDYIEYKTFGIQDSEAKTQKKIQLIKLFQENNNPIPEPYQQFTEAYLLYCEQQSPEALQTLQQDSRTTTQIQNRITQILRTQ